VGTKVLDPFRACVKAGDCYTPFSVDTLTCVKSLETCVESVFATIPKQFAIADCFLLFW
jgi:hypothetical protein